MKSTLFLFQYFLKPREIGALVPSSSYLADRMMQHVHFETARFIVEYGAGTGVFTDKILRLRNPKTVVMIIETNEGFCERLRMKYRHEPNLIIIHGGAENIDVYMKENNIPSIDYIISGLPFISLPRQTSRTILNKTKRLLTKNGRFITFQYTLFKKNYFNTFFTCMDVKWEFRNLPPAYVLTYRRRCFGDGGSA